jgi:amphi-Trp domain-containing protein
MSSKEGKERIQFSGTVSAQEAAQYLESLAKGLRERAMLLESGDSSITIEVSDEVKVEIDASASSEKGKASIDVSLGWRARAQEEAAPPPGLLIIAGAHAADVPAAFAE